MPILPLEPSVHPPDLFERLSEGAYAAESFWHVLYVLPRHEKKLVRQLISSDIPCCLPLASQVRTKHGRISHLPLFSSYVFLYGNADDRLEAMKTGSVICSLDVEDQARLTRELRQVYKIVKDGQSQLRLEPRLWCGAAVRIIRGPLKGLEGVLREHKDDTRLMVYVRVLNQGVSIPVVAADIGFVSAGT